MRLKILILCLIIGGCGIKTKNKNKDFLDLTFNKQQFKKKSFKVDGLNVFDFNSLVLSNNANLEYNNSNYSFDINIKIRKNKKILITGGFIIPLFKILIEPDKILGYQKIDKTYFKTELSDIYNKLGFILDFNQLQNILTGEPLNDITSIANYNTYEIDKNLIVYEYSNDEFSVSLFVDTNLNKLLAQEIKQIELGRELSIYYKDFKETNNLILHTSSKIVVNDGKNLINLYMSTNSTDTSDEILFSFEIPNNYRKIKF